MSSGRDASSSARKMLAIRLVFCTLSRRRSPVAKKRSRALSLNDQITPRCKPEPYICQELPYNRDHGPRLGHVNLPTEALRPRPPQGWKSAVFDAARPKRLELLTSRYLDRRSEASQVPVHSPPCELRADDENSRRVKETPRRRGKHPVMNSCEADISRSASRPPPTPLRSASPSRRTCW